MTIHAGGQNGDRRHQISNVLDAVAAGVRPQANYYDIHVNQGRQHALYPYIYIYCPQLRGLCRGEDERLPVLCLGVLVIQRSDGAGYLLLWGWHPILILMIIAPSEDTPTGLPSPIQKLGSFSQHNRSRDFTRCVGKPLELG